MLLTVVEIGMIIAWYQFILGTVALGTYITLILWTEVSNRQLSLKRKNN